jgi:hypothetical protein
MVIRRHTTTTCRQLGNDTTYETEQKDPTSHDVTDTSAVSGRRVGKTRHHVVKTNCGRHLKRRHFQLRLHQTSPHPAIVPPQHPPQTAPPYLPKQDPLHACGHHEHDIYGDHAFCCERGSKKRAHNVIAMDFAGALSLLFLHKPATFFLTHPWQSNHCSTSTQTRQHDRSTFHSLLIPPHMPLLPIHHYWGRHQHHRPPAYPQPTNLTLKTL